MLNQDDHLNTNLKSQKNSHNFWWNKQLWFYKQNYGFTNRTMGLQVKLWFYKLPATGVGISEVNFKQNGRERNTRKSQQITLSSIKLSNI